MKLEEYAKKRGWKIRKDKNKHGLQRIRAYREADGEKFIVMEEEDLPA